MLERYLNWSYWFSTRAVPFTEQVARYFLVTLIVMAVIGLVAKIIGWYRKILPWGKLYKRIGNLLLTEVVLLGINFFFTQTSTPALGSRWWFGLWLLVAIIWLVFILRYAIWHLPKELRDRKIRQEFEKYLPKSKNN